MTAGIVRMRLCAATLCLLAVAPLAAALAGTTVAEALQEPASARPTFEVASIKKNARPVRIPPSQQPGQRPDVYYASSVTVAFLIRFAYDIRDAELVGGPAWIHRDEFEINAKAAGEASTNEMRLMLQSLLEERFSLVVRRERREMRFFELRLARDDRRPGPLLQPCEDPETARSAPPGPPVRLPGSVPAQMRCRPIGAVAEMAAGWLQAPVVDRTGLPGLWSFAFMFLQPQGAAGPEREAADVERVPTFEAALYEHLGLALESRRGPIDALVVDSVEQPTEN